MGTTTYKNCTWHAIRSGNICPICGSKKGRCSLMINEKNEVILYRCKYKESSRPSKDGWYLHLVNDKSSNTPLKKEIDIKDYTPEEISEELLDLWDKIYRKFRELFYKYNGDYLYKEHKDNLLKRGLSEEQIKNFKVFSIPSDEKVTRYNQNGTSYQCKLKTAIISDLLEVFKESDLIRVPGFSKVEINSNGKKQTYISFKNTIKNKLGNFEYSNGYFIPYTDYKGRIVGMQFRLTTPLIDDKGKAIRYLWYVTKNGASCGSPIDYHIPNKINSRLDNTILITEGALKAKIASEMLGIRSIAAAGVSNYRKLVKELQKVSENENKRYNIILALDMDKYGNNDVLSAEINTVSLLKLMGYNVSILEWDINHGKGIDDKLVNSEDDGIRFMAI